MKKTSILIFIVLILSVLTACNVSYTEDWESSKDIVSRDGILQLTVPDNYAEVGNLNEVANLQMVNEENLQYLITIAEPKSYYEESYTLDDYYDFLSQLIASNLESVDLSDAKSVTIGDYTAQQFSISGTASNIRIKFLVTLIETDSFFYQIESWAMQYLYYDYEATFKRIAESLVELQESA